MKTVMIGFKLLEKTVQFLAQHWLIVLVVLVTLTALAKLTAIRKNRRKFKRQNQALKHPQNTSYAIDFKSGIHVSNRIISLINQRLSLDNTDDMAWLKGQYEILHQELQKRQNIDIDPRNLTQFYLQHYQDSSSELLDRMHQLERIIYGEEQEIKNALFSTRFIQSFNVPFRGNLHHCLVLNLWCNFTSKYNYVDCKLRHYFSHNSRVFLCSSQLRI